MKKILIFGALIGAIWASLKMDEAMVYFLLNNAMWVLVVGVMAVIILYLIANIVKLNRHEITIYDNRQWNTDNSTTNTAYINQHEPSQIADPRQMLTERW